MTTMQFFASAPTCILDLIHTYKEDMETKEWEDAADWVTEVVHDVMDICEFMHYDEHEEKIKKYRYVVDVMLTKTCDWSYFQKVHFIEFNLHMYDTFVECERMERGFGPNTTP